MATAPYTFRINSPRQRTLEREALIGKRPANQLAAQAIKSMAQVRESKRAAIDAALGEAEAGEFISEKAIFEWIDSWGSDNEQPMPKPDIRKPPK